MRAVIGVVALLALVVRAADAVPEDPFQAYRSAHPDVPDEDLLEVSAGDPVSRVLAVIHHPDSGIGPREVRALEVVMGGVEARPVAALSGASGDEAAGDYLLEVVQECELRQGGAPARPTTWLYLEKNRLVAWQIQPYAKACRREAPLFEASDHDAMRVVGRQLFRAVGQGSFRYGALLYERWADAFEAPSRDAMVSLLRAEAAERPRDARALNRLAVGLYASGDRDGALETLRRAAELEPGWPVVHRNLAAVYFQRGDRTAAEREARLAETPRGEVGSGPPIP